MGERCEKSCMVEIVHLAPPERMPAVADDEPWLIIEASNDGRFFGTGEGGTPSGVAKFYASLSEHDVSLETALDAACKWAVERGVMRIWGQTTRA